MKLYLLTILFCTLFLNLASGQDVITKKSGEELKVKVLEITQTEIKYKKSDNPEGPVYILPKSEVLIIQYENNIKEVFSSPEADAAQNLVASTKPTSAMSTRPGEARDMYYQGQNDAKNSYNGYTGAGTGTLFASLLSPLVGLVPAIICSSTKPKEQNLNFPDYELMKNMDYNRGYTQSSKKIKSRHVWKNWGIGFGVNIVAVVLLSQQQ